MGRILSIKDLKVEYFAEGAVIPALRGVDFTLEKGECVGVVGESGCGKSTLALAILNLIDKIEGRITCGDVNLYLNREKGVVNLRDLPADEMRNIRGRRISLILQDPYNSLNPVIRVGNQLKEAYLAHNKDSSKADEVIKEKLEAVHLASDSSITDSYPHQLSGGMLQRVSIAMALLNSPQILIADEPTSNLDVTIQKKIIETLKNLKKRFDLSLIFITHNLNLVSEFADRIYILYAGRFVECGTLFRIFSNPAHPYTRGLLKALPHISEPGRKISPIPGSVPSPTDILCGCGFAPRCEHKKNECSEDEIRMEEIEPGHFVRCIC